jgi:NAD dependent epimerase/dehydratase family enzyme
MKVTLTGATGFIGSHVLDELQKHGHAVFAEALLLGQGTDAPRAQAELGWQPSHPSLADEFRHGSYRR